MTEQAASALEIGASWRTEESKILRNPDSAAPSFCKIAVFLLARGRVAIMKQIVVPKVWETHRSPEAGLQLPSAPGSLTNSEGKWELQSNNTQNARPSFSQSCVVLLP